ncbi:MAG: integrase family protein [Methylobacterium organophilum]|nr:integrase family protein [Methylobacterium organophilum]
MNPQEKLITHGSENLRSILTNREIEYNREADIFSVPASAHISSLQAVKKQYYFNIDILFNEKIKAGRHPKKAWSDIGLPNEIRDLIICICDSTSIDEYITNLAGFIKRLSLLERAKSSIFNIPASGARSMELLVLLWRHGLILFPPALIWAKGACEWVRTLPPYEEYWYGDANAVISRFDRTELSKHHYARVKKVLMTFILSTNGIREVGDIDSSLTKAYWQTKPEELEKDLYKPAYVFCDRLRDEQKADYKDNAGSLAKIPGTYRPHFRQELRRSDPDFKWCRVAHPHLSAWTDFCTQFIGNLKNRTSLFTDALAMSVVLDFAAQHVETPSDPLDFCLSINASQHENLRSFVRSQSEANDFTLNRKIKVVERAFDFLLRKRARDENGDVLFGFRNPIAEDSYVPVPRRPGQTHRRPIPQKFVRMLCEILDEEDEIDTEGRVTRVAWAKTIEADYFTWRDDTGNVSRVWSPVRRDLIRLRFELPLRTFQARMLDSGEGDAEVYRPELGGWTTNDGPWAPSRVGKRPQGFVRQMLDEELGQQFNGLYVTTNKTQDRAAAGEDDFGYEVPWENPKIISIFCGLRDWQERFNPLTRPMTRADIKDQMFHSSADVIARLPKLHFLFRDPCSKYNKDEPVSDSRLNTFWCLLVEELERRLIVKSIHNPDGSHIRLVTSRCSLSHMPKSVEFDMHSVRVTGLTSLANAGVPLHILSSFVAGHATYIMTLYYQRPSVGEVTRRLHEATMSIEDQDEAEWIDYIAENTSSISSFAAYNDSSVFDELRNYQTGLWSKMDIGLCPNGGTKCSSGGELVRKNVANGDVHAAVPGGSRNCALCRFFVTGPLYLGGLVAKLNQTSGEIRENILSTRSKEEQRRLAVGELDAFSAAQTEQRRRTKVKLSQLDEVIEGLQTTLEVLSRKWAGLFRLIIRCRQILNTNSSIGAEDRNPTNSLVLNGGLSDLRVAFSACTDFTLWDSICRSSEFYPDVDSTLPALRRGKMFDVVFGRGNLPPLFVTLSDDEAVAVGNELSHFLRGEVGGEGLEALVYGRSSLDELGIRSEVEKWAKHPVNTPQRFALPTSVLMMEHKQEASIANTI